MNRAPITIFPDDLVGGAETLPNETLGAYVRLVSLLRRRGDRIRWCATTQRDLVPVVRAKTIRGVGKLLAPLFELGKLVVEDGWLQLGPAATEFAHQRRSVEAAENNPQPVDNQMSLDLREQAGGGEICENVSNFDQKKSKIGKNIGEYQGTTATSPFPFPLQESESESESPFAVRASPVEAEGMRLGKVLRLPVRDRAIPGRDPPRRLRPETAESRLLLAAMEKAGMPAEAAVGLIYAAATPTDPGHAEALPICLRLSKAYHCGWYGPRRESG